MNFRSSLEQIERDGFTIVEDAIEPDLVAALREDLLRLERELGIAPGAERLRGRARPGASTTCWCTARSTSAIPVHANVLPIVEGVLDDGCLVSSLSSIAIGPGETAQPIHADDQLIPLDKPHRADRLQHDVGAHRLHRGERRDAPRPRHATRRTARRTSAARTTSIPAEMPAGSVLVWHGSLWHGGGANRTGERRVGIAMNYCAGFIRQQENQQLGIPREIAARFSPRLQRAGAATASTAHLIGHIDKRDPIELLGEGGDLKTVWEIATRRS